MGKTAEALKDYDAAIAAAPGNAELKAEKKQLEAEAGPQHYSTTFHISA